MTETPPITRKNRLEEIDEMRLMSASRHGRLFEHGMRYFDVWEIPESDAAAAEREIRTWMMAGLSVSEIRDALERTR